MKLMTYPCKMGCICFLTSKLAIFLEVDTLFVIFKKNKISKQSGKNGALLLMAASDTWFLSAGGWRIFPIGVQLADKSVGAS